MIDRWARAAAWLYGVLLKLRYPRDLRAAYGHEMRADFQRWARESGDEGGIRAVLGTLGRAAADLARPLPRAPRPPHEGRGAERRPSGGQWLIGVSQNFAFAARSLAREPRFSTVVIGVLSIGIALNVAVFSVVHAYLLRPLPYPESDRLYDVTAWGAISWTEVEDLFEVTASWDLDVFTIVGEPNSELVRGAWVSPGFTEAYGVRPALGRSFATDEVGPSGPSVAMIGYDLWQGRFGGDPDVVGKTFRAYMSDRPEASEQFVVVGVLPEDFWHINPYTQILVPMRDDRSLYAGRLHPGIDVDYAEEALTRLALPRVQDAPADFRVTLASVREAYVAELRPTLRVVQIAAILVLLIASANAAVLLLIRSIRREREIGVRKALGASHGRLAGQLLAEGLLLAGAAGAFGLGAATWLVATVREQVGVHLGRTAPGGLNAVTIDASVLAASLGLVLMVGLLFGAVPLLATARGRLSGLLSKGARSGDSRGRRRVRLVLVTSELTLTLALLMGAGLMVRSALFVQGRDPGFRPEMLVRGEVGLREPSYPEPAERVRFFTELIADLEGAPEVQSVALASSVPFTSARRGQPVHDESAEAFVDAVTAVVDERYFATIGQPLLEGRPFSMSDGLGSERVAIVTRTLADELFPSRSPIGQRIGIAEVGPAGASRSSDELLTVVGVVGDVERGLGRPPRAELYIPFRQEGRLWMSVIVRGTPGSTSVADVIADRLRAHDVEAPLTGVVRIEEAITAAAAPTRFLSALFAGFAGFALILAVVGIYGVMAYAAVQARREIAIRVALGADQGRVTRFFLVSGSIVTATGIVLGSLGGVGLGRALETQLLGVAAWDPLSHALLAGTLAMTTLLAVWWPARRAARTAPMGVLHEE